MPPHKQTLAALKVGALSVPGTHLNFPEAEVTFHWNLRREKAKAAGRSQVCSWNSHALSGV
jgi:hypothetical protein